jgi:hypothetical protein
MVRTCNSKGLIDSSFSALGHVPAKLAKTKLCLNLGDAHHQTARFSVSLVTSTPSLNLITSITFGN